MTGGCRLPLGTGTLGRQGLRGHVTGRWALFPWVAVPVEVPCPLRHRTWELCRLGAWEPVAGGSLWCRVFPREQRAIHCCGCLVPPTTKPPGPSSAGAGQAPCYL